jgi:hypothetical protein
LPSDILCGDKACHRALTLAQVHARRASQCGTLICRSCGEGFIPKRTGTRFCSPACRERGLPAATP